MRSFFTEEISEGLKNLRPPPFPIKEDKGAMLKIFLSRFSICPICRNRNHKSHLENVYNSKEPWKVALKQQLFKLINQSKDNYENIAVGIPCCTCFKMIFEKNETTEHLREQTIIRLQNVVEETKKNKNIGYRIIREIEDFILTKDLYWIRSHTFELEDLVYKWISLDHDEGELLTHLRTTIHEDNIINFSKRFKVKDGHVIALILNYCGLMVLHEGYQAFSKLEYLDLSDNLLKELPHWFLSHESLKCVAIMNNYIEHIPESFSKIMFL